MEGSRTMGDQKRTLTLNFRNNRRKIRMNFC